MKCFIRICLFSMLSNTTLAQVDIIEMDFNWLNNTSVSGISTNIIKKQNFEIELFHGFLSFKALTKGNYLFNVYQNNGEIINPQANPMNAVINILDNNPLLAPYVPVAGGTKNNTPLINIYSVSFQNFNNLFFSVNMDLDVITYLAPEITLLNIVPVNASVTITFIITKIGDL